jgi:hypothetical protein
MRCQSDYDDETDVLLSQADQCVEEWWPEEKLQRTEPSSQPSEEEGENPALIVKGEVRKRGLIEVNEEAGL